MFGKLFYANLALCIAFVAILVWYWAYEVTSFSSLFNLPEGTSLGDWGDSFSALNTAFSGLAFIGVLFSLLAQRRTLNIQIHRNALEEHERTFFQLLSMAREQREALSYSDAAAIRRRGIRQGAVNTFNDKYISTELLEGKSEKLDGAKAIALAYDTFQSELIERRVSSRARIDLISKDERAKAHFARTVARIYSISVHEDYEANFGPYFRNIYSILRRIDENKFLTQDQKDDYSRIFRGQLGGDEVILLGANSLSDQAKDLKDYLTKYKMLKYAQKGAARELLEAIYPKEAFEPRRN